MIQRVLVFVCAKVPADWYRLSIHVPPKKNAGFGRNETDTENATRWVSVKPYVMEMLKQHLNGRKEGLVFQTKRKTPLVNGVVLNKHLHPLLRELGLKRWRHPRFQTSPSQYPGHRWNGACEMVNRNTNLDPDFMQSELPN